MLLQNLLQQNLLLWLLDLVSHCNSIKHWYCKLLYCEFVIDHAGYKYALGDYNDIMERGCLCLMSVGKSGLWCSYQVFKHMHLYVCIRVEITDGISGQVQPKEPDWYVMIFLSFYFSYRHKISAGINRNVMHVFHCFL